MKLVPVLLLLVSIITGCNSVKYSPTSISSSAKTIQIEQFENNTDLGPANLGQTFTNNLKDYYQRNSGIKVVRENAELQIDGKLTTYSVTNIAPVAGPITPVLPHNHDLLLALSPTTSPTTNRRTAKPKHCTRRTGEENIRSDIDEYFQLYCG